MSTAEESIELLGYRLHELELVFEPGTYENIFRKKNNKTLAETLKHRRYRKLGGQVRELYAEHLEQPLGEFLLEMKERGDPFYKKFLNRYGDLVYSRFRLGSSSSTTLKGVYAYFVGKELKYIGRCRDSMAKRVNSGYGIIHPKNCFLDGQATNCHLNALITSISGAISLWLYAHEDDAAIKNIEVELIGKYRPEWNIQYG